MTIPAPQTPIVVPHTLTEALSLLTSRPGGWRPLAGGTDLMVVHGARPATTTPHISIRHLPELRAIEVTPEECTIGACVTYTQIQAHPTLQQEFPMLCAAARCTGAVAIQNRGTLGGNIANGSPAADSPPALLAYHAALTLASVRGTRRILYGDFHTGYKQSHLAADELIQWIHLPRTTAGCMHHYRKVGTRGAQAISKVCFAGLGRMRDGLLEEIRIALGSVAPTPLRCTRTEALLRRQSLTTERIAEAVATIGEEIAPIDDLRSTATYRRRVVQNILRTFLHSLR